MGRTSMDGNSIAGNRSSLYHGQNNHHQLQQQQQPTSTHHQQNGIDSDKPTYALEHLATFKVKHESEIRNPIAKMKLLMEMDRTVGIWPQKMYMCFNSQWIVILDKDKVEIESFPGSLIQEPTAFISKDPLEAYNNILVFAVSGSSLGNTEMHVFQVEDVSAVHLVEDLKLLRSGKIITQRREGNENKAKPHPNDKDQYGIREAMNKSRDDEISKANAERDIVVLNHCFEDIEKFVLRLHYAAEALRELEIRKNENKLNTNPHGEGLLILRSRPPVENEFVDIFAKFKLGFNFVTRLQAHIPDIKVPIHGMFVSLQTIVTVCNDVYVGTKIPQSVVNPLLRRETINLLESCVTQKESEFWQSLGKNWTLPKDQFKDHKSSYHPIFFDDWSPDFIVDEPVAYLPPPIIKTEERLDNDIMNNTWHRKLQSRNVRIAEVTYARPAKTDKELTVTKGEYLEVIDDSRKWWKARNSRGQIGYVPNTILAAQNFETSTLAGKPSDTESLSSSIYDQDNGRTTRTSLYAFETEREQPKQVLPRRSISVPPPPPPPPPTDSTPTTPVSTLQRDMQRDKQRDMALAGALVAMRARNDCDTENMQDDVQEELRNKLMLRESRKDLEILKTPQIYIESTSNAKAVEEWLRGKGFSDKVIKKLHGLTGAELFALSNPTIESYFDDPERRRLISQITLQKKFSGYKTSRSSELQAILARARKKAGEPNGETFDEVF